MLKPTLNKYHNRAIATQEVIEELIKLAKQLQEADQRGVETRSNVDAAKLNVEGLGGKGQGAKG